MDLQLAGKVALVTGATSGVGRAIALTLAAEGAAVALSYRSSSAAAEALAAEIAAQGGRAIVCAADVGDQPAVAAMVAHTVGELGRLDILVNNAGLAIRRHFAETTPEEWRQQIDAGLYGAIHCIHAAAPHLEKAGAGRIVSLVGDSSRVGESGLAVTAAARAGVIGLTKSVARELGRFGVTANVVSLGLVETAHHREWLDANRDRLVRLYPMRRLGRPEDVAPLVALLASEHGGWITGQVISVSGGYSMV